MDSLKRTALFELHKKQGGKIIDYAGWALPVEFSGITAEHTAVRSAGGIFDVSHMGEVEVKGNQALEYIQNLITNDVSVLVEDQILYTPMCYLHGGIVDDLLVYKFSNHHFLLVINASNTEKDLQWMKGNAINYDVEITNISQNVAQIAVQGPKAEEVLQELTETKLSAIDFFYCKRDVNIAGTNCLISRTGYTGEDGFEIYLDPRDAEFFWEEVIELGKEKGIKPIGLGARDTLRFEAALPLYGNELCEYITPLEAGLDMFVKFNKPHFIGKQALLKQKEEGLKRKIVGFVMEENGIPRHGYRVIVEERDIGFVTTGYHAPTLKKNIGLAMVDIAYTVIGTPIKIQIRKKVLEATVVSKKFYRRGNQHA
ncbi:aminomethyltransferase [Anaerovirgula multivorans]|uniref:Aminomethyltransferase n=1 Tax=Anaerovirgula multivorans TaxID=312168 RepID=A0A239BB37_9FIRM|nr:glycine cleavage system aminomethyltransferase GcvT [Anaerovirgula multivorans]SNS04668.1 aminomethyltransferase [Anaerovirgula multivorans]